jgi:hypothetical protein
MKTIPNKSILIIPADCLAYIAESLRADDKARRQHKKLDRSPGRRLLEIVEDARDNSRRVQWRKNPPEKLEWELTPYGLL